MKITRKSLRRLIFEMLDEVEVKRAGTVSGFQETGKLLSVLGALQATELLTLLLQGAGSEITGSGGKPGAAAIMKKALLQKAKNSASSLIRTAGRTAAPVFLAIAVWDAFNYLPNMLQKSLEQLDTVEGVLKELKRLSPDPGPIKLTDIARTPGKTLIAKSWSRYEMVDYLAASMETPEGRSLYSELIANEYTDLRGKKSKGPIIDQDFSTAILKRRETIKSEAAEKIKEKLIANIKEGALSEEESRQLASQLSKTA